jgi:hypothetical protein
MKANIIIDCHATLRSARNQGKRTKIKNSKVFSSSLYHKQP